MIHKGIILAGGSGTRLHPTTKVVNKHLLPIYDKPMIYYSLSTLVDAGIKDILIISTPEDIVLFERLLGDGSQWGIELSYEIQMKPNGLSEAFIIGKDFIGKDNVTLILGDNIFWGNDFVKGLKRSIRIAEDSHDACIFGYKVKDPNRYGVMGFDGEPSNDDTHRLNSIEEKPENPKSNYAVIGLYTYHNNVIDYVKDVKPSARGELEITSLNQIYLDKDELDYVLIDNKNNIWLDTGTHNSLLEASHFVETMQNRTGIKIGL